MEKNKDFNFSNDGKKLIQYEGDSTNVFIPEGVETIQGKAFEKNNCIKKVILPSTIKHINKEAFKECNELEHIEFHIIPDNMYGCSFCNCKCLNEIIIHNNTLIHVPISTFGKYVIPIGIERISRGAFCGCVDITELDIPQGVKQIEEYAFNGLLNLRRISIPASVESIAERAFIDCGKVETIIVDKYNPKYDSRNDCNAIVETEINRIVFGCSKTIFDETITSIGIFAFAYCSELKNLSIPESITEINDSAFTNCNNLTFVELPSTLKSVKDCVFSECKNLERVVLNEGIERISPLAFIFCDNIKSINIPNSFVPDDDTIQQFNMLFQSIDTPLYNKNLFVSLPQTYHGHYIVPDGITEIFAYAFNGCDHLTGITLPDSISVIQESAFKDCINLSNVEWGNAYTAGLSVIGSSAFEGCQMLYSIIIPRNVSVIKQQAFKDCRNLHKIEFVHSSLKEIGESAFEGCTSLEDIEIPYGLNKIEAYTFKNCKNLQYIRIPNSVESIFDSAFSGCNNINTAVMSNRWENHQRVKLGLPPYRTSIYDDDDEPLTGLGATEDGPMICTEGQMWPCPYCRSYNIQTYLDGTAQCEDCHRWYKYMPTGF